MDYTVNVNEDGYINKAYYKNASLDIIQRQIQDKQLDPNKITANQLKALFRQCYYSLFEPETNNFPPYNANIPYNTKNIEILLSIYTEICEIYSCIPSLYGFTRFTGIEEETIQKYVTAARLEMVKARKDYVQNSLSNSQVGTIALANNDTDTGLMYTRQNLVDKQTIQQNITLKDFVRISSAQSDATKKQ